jgi:hypothetical protein
MIGFSVSGYYIFLLATMKVVPVEQYLKLRIARYFE